jgi:tripartite ATP-independent transporter DctM subunit
MALSYFWIFIFLMAAGMPVVFALLVGPGLSLAFEGDQVFYKALLSRLYSGMDSFPLMALPFFILAGHLMNSGGITRSIVDFSQSMIGHVRGGLAQVNILSSVLFAGLSGSAVADTSALGKIFIPAMEQNGYSRSFGAAVTAASSVIGPIIPPSGIMILYDLARTWPRVSQNGVGTVDAGHLAGRYSRGNIHTHRSGGRRRFLRPRRYAVPDPYIAH